LLEFCFSICSNSVLALLGCAFSISPLRLSHLAFAPFFALSARFSAFAAYPLWSSHWWIVYPPWCSSRYPQDTSTDTRSPFPVQSTASSMSSAESARPPGYLLSAAYAHSSSRLRTPSMPSARFNRLVLTCLKKPVLTLKSGIATPRVEQKKGTGSTTETWTGKVKPHGFRLAGRARAFIIRCDHIISPYRSVCQQPRVPGSQPNR
jgi:hypothetical protein